MWKLCLALLAFDLYAKNSPAALWTELQAKRERLTAAHLEYELTEVTTSGPNTHDLKRKVILDTAQLLWREAAFSGSGVQLLLFDGTDVLAMDIDGKEYIRTKAAKKDENPLPMAYVFHGANWSKMKEMSRRPCGLPGNDHQCVVFGIPIQQELRALGGNTFFQIVGGAELVLLDIETGLMLSRRTLLAAEDSARRVRTETTYLLKRFALPNAADSSLFQLPQSGFREVKQFTPWNASRMRNELADTRAPQLQLTDMQGKSFSIADLKGKTILLDFWTTWCPPCRADGPALDELHRKFGEQGLVILSISVSEERDIVEHFLKEHPHAFPVALTTENEMPKHYQVQVFPTYIVIDRNGSFVTAMEGEQGFSGLKKQLSRAGLDD